MIIQNYTAKSLRKGLRKGDLNKWSIKYEDIEKTMLVYENFLDFNNFRLQKDDIVSSNRWGKNYFEITSEAYILAYRYLNNLLRTIYSLAPSNKDEIIQTLIQITQEPSNLEIVKLDISSFYESTNFDEILKQIRDDSLIAYDGICLLDSLNKIVNELDGKGIPRGISISSTLSEFALRKIDKKIKSLPDVFYYFRYVDDIIIITPIGNGEKNIVKQVSSLLIANGYKLNEDKQSIFSLENKKIVNNNRIRENQNSLYYLGYELVKKEKKNNRIFFEWIISQKTINRQMNRTARAFLLYDKNHDFYLLRSRLRYLSMSFPVSKTNQSVLYGGFSANYKYATNFDNLKILDNFLDLILSEKNRIGRKVCPWLKEEYKIELRKISFYGNFKNQKKTNFSFRKLKDIRRDFI